MRPTHKIDPYGGADPRELPSYIIAEAAHYLSIPRNTVGSWVRGRNFAAKDGQLAMREMLGAYLRRIDRDEKGLAVRLYPFTRPSSELDGPRLIMIDPRRAFGRPVIAGTRIPTTDVFERFKAGDSFEDLVAEYGRSTQEIQEAIRYEAELAA